MDEQTASAWDGAAATFDESADHGLRDPAVRSAWAALLTRVLPSPPSRVADLGCGTGSLTKVAAELGHRVDGVDFSDEMLAVARTKAGDGAGITFSRGDAAEPDLPAGAYDAVMCRHLLWAVPDRGRALRAWSALLRPGGRIVMIEGRWSTGAGLPREELAQLLAGQNHAFTIETLDDAAFWGSAINDDRYVAIARRQLP